MKPTYEEISRAYAELNLRPCFRSYFGPNSCCPLSILYLKKCGVDFFQADSVQVWEWAANLFGFDWACGFIKGVDGNILLEGALWEVKQGRAFGQEVREKLSANKC